jgi:abnormal spindle-like microcephaly-associated protein
VHISGLKHGVLKLFMSYNPLWLRIGLEIVCDTLIPMKSHTDLNTLTYFLINRYIAIVDKFILIFVFLHRVLSPKAVLGISHAFLDEKNRLKFNKFVTKKYLMLVYLLDQAKNSRLIRHDPCLFLKNSDVKVSFLSSSVSIP